jgi:acetyl esterase
MLDPDIRRLLDTVFNVAPNPGPPDVTALRAAGEGMPKLLGGEPEPVAVCHDDVVPGAGGPISIRLYRPEAATPTPALVYAHGGGWVTGSLESHDRLCRILANRLAACVIAIDYRCAPEHVFPAALDDVEAVWTWAQRHAEALGIDGQRIAIGGDSSGANLAAALTLRLRAQHLPQPRAQLLLYPALDATSSLPSYAAFATGYNLAAAQMRWYWDVYRAGAAPQTPELSPLASADLAGLAPAVIAIAACDVLRDDGLSYAKRLRAAGTPATLIDCAGMIHGFLRWTGAVPAASAWADTIAVAMRATMD